MQLNKAEFLNEFCNELAQPITVLNLTLQLMEQGKSFPEDFSLIKAEVDRLAVLVENLRQAVNNAEPLAA